MTDATTCVVCGGPFSAKRVWIDGRQYHNRCALMSYGSHTPEDYARLSDAFAAADYYIDRLEAAQQRRVVRDMTEAMEGYRAARAAITAGDQKS